MQRFTVVLAAAWLFAAGASWAQAPAHPQSVQPQGQYAQIDTRLSRASLALLAEGTPQDQQDVLALLRTQPSKFQPPVLYAVSQTLWQAGEKEEAAFWFYAGQLRARIDANLSADRSAAQAV